MKKLAVFDIDGTIFRSSLIIELLLELVSQKVFPKEALEMTEKEYLAWVNRKGHYEEYIGKVVDSYKLFIGGCKVSDFEKAEDKVIDAHKDKVYRFTRDLITKLKKEGYFLIALSGSPSGIVSKYSKAFNFDTFIGSNYEIESGYFTGVLLKDPFRDGKDKALLKYIEESGFEFNLQESIAIGDSHGDISMLEIVGNPIAFNPSMTLAKVAKKKVWRVVVERKDVIYEVKNFEFLELH